MSAVVVWAVGMVVILVVAVGLVVAAGLVGDWRDRRRQR